MMKAVTYRLLIIYLKCKEYNISCYVYFAVVVEYFVEFGELLDTRRSAFVFATKRGALLFTQGRARYHSCGVTRIGRQQRDSLRVSHYFSRLVCPDCLTRKRINQLSEGERESKLKFYTKAVI